MGELTWLDKLKNWWETANQNVVFETIFQPNTVMAILVGGSTLGAWGYFPEKFKVIAGGLCGAYTIYNLASNNKKKIRAAAEKLIVESVAPQKN